MPVWTLGARAATETPQARGCPFSSAPRLEDQMFSLPLAGVSFALTTAVACGSDYSTPPTTRSPER